MDVPEPFVFLKQAGEDTGDRPDTASFWGYHAFPSEKSRNSRQYIIALNEPGLSSLIILSVSSARVPARPLRNLMIAETQKAKKNYFWRSARGYVVQKKTRAEVKLILLHGIY